MSKNVAEPVEVIDEDQATRATGRTLAHVVYALQAVALVTGIPMLIGVIVNYVTRGEVRGSWIDSHYSWQIRTFWYSLLWTVLGTLTIVILVGYLVLTLAYLWLVYRIILGWIKLANSEPMYEGR
ncbi:MAG: hypothetical protein U9R74_09450 [Pseudomonadota bacterium]|nr:hypothetical protein [Pseudomonadota bacterium]